MTRSSTGSSESHEILGSPDLLEHRGPRRGLLHGVNDYLHVLPAGRPSVNPSLLLSPEAVDTIVKHVGSFADVVVFDVPLTDRIAELGLVAERVDAIVLVIRNHLTRTEERRVGEDLTALGVQPSGVVVVRTRFFSRFLRRVPPPPGAHTHTNEAHAALLTVDAEAAPARQARADRQQDTTGARPGGSAKSSRRSGNRSDPDPDPDLDPDSDQDTGPRAEASYGTMDADPTESSGGGSRSRRAPANRRSRTASDGPAIAADAPATKNNGHEPLAARDAADRIDAVDAVDMDDPLNGFEYRTRIVRPRPPRRHLTGAGHRVPASSSSSYGKDLLDGRPRVRPTVVDLDAPRSASPAESLEPRKLDLVELDRLPAQHRLLLVLAERFESALGTGARCQPPLHRLDRCGDPHDQIRRQIISPRRGTLEGARQSPR